MAYWIKIKTSDRAPRFEFEDERSDNLFFGLSLGLPISPQRVPSIAREVTKKKIYPDVFRMPGLNAVSQRFKDLVEDFEPGVHQFFPLALRASSGELVHDQYYIFNCTVSVDSLLVNKSNVKWLDLDSEVRSPRLELVWGRELTISSQAVAGKHVWQSFRITTQRGLLVSDEFFAELKKRKIKYLNNFHCNESDEIWDPLENISPILNWERIHGLQHGMKPWLLQNSEKLY